MLGEVAAQEPEREEEAMRRTTTRARYGMVLVCVLLAASGAPGAAQLTLERTPALSGGWVPQPGLLVLTLPQRFHLTGGDVAVSPTYGGAFGLGGELAAGARFAPGSAVVPGEPDEWELFGRYAPLAQFRGAPVDLAATAAFNGAAGSLDAELSAARWLGRTRLLGAARVLTSPYGGGDVRYALAGGAVVHPRPGSLPIALAADVGTLLDRGEGEEVAWSAAVQVGVSFTPYTLSLFATNTASGTLQGVSRGGGPTRFGVELTLPVPVGRFLGWYVPREEAAEAVAEEPGAQPAVAADIARYLFLPRVIRVAPGATVEWTNRDGVVHTVSADDGSWGSGAIQPGESWSARFDRPGRYPYHCGPHPFMQGMVIVE